MGMLQVVRKTLAEFDKEEVIRHIDQILDYYKSKLEELQEYKRAGRSTT